MKDTTSSKKRKELSMIQKFFSLGNYWYDLTWVKEDQEQIWARKVEKYDFDSKFDVSVGYLGGYV